MMPNSEMSAIYRPPGQGSGTPTLLWPEDCGGIDGYELVSAASDVAHPDHAEALRTFREWYGDGVLEHFRPTPFDIDELNSALTEFGSGEGLPKTPDTTGGQVRVSAALLGRMPTSTQRRKLLRVMNRAKFGQPISRETQDSSTSVRSPAAPRFSTMSPRNR